MKRQPTSHNSWARSTVGVALLATLSIAVSHSVNSLASYGPSTALQPIAFVEDTTPNASESGVSFTADIRPILSNRCFKCHGPDENTREAELRLDVFQEDGAIVIGDPDASELIRRIASTDPELRMPPVETGDPLSDSEIEQIRQWIRDGAEYEPHWAFVAPRQRELPEVNDTTWPRNEIDSFILSRLESEKFAPSPQADRHTLIRRVYLDLTGLPPTPDDLAQFVNDDRPDAYERMIERALASPHFGERWASVWLDLARYADTKGYEADRRRTIWPYRDWVIRALNDDKSFDDFTTEQIAGDLLPDATEDHLLATAFHRNTMTNDESGTDDEEFRVAAVVDRVNTTMQTWMGMTMACAQCHTHKYDPIEHREYYEFFAFFNNTADTDQMDDAPLHSFPTPEQQAQLKTLLEEREHIGALLSERITGFDDDDEPFDPTHVSGFETTAGEFVWVDDDPPPAARVEAQGTPTTWEWVETTDIPSIISGERAMRRSADDAMGQHFFTEAWPPVPVFEGDRLFAHVLIDPDDPPREIMLQWHTREQQWKHRAYWGEHLIQFGEEGTTELRHFGDLPNAGEWIRLEVSASDVGIEPGMALTGLAFTQFGGTVYWDAAGIQSDLPRDTSWLYDQAAWEHATKTIEGAKLPDDLQAIVQQMPSERTPDEARIVREHFLAHVNPRSRRELRPLLNAQAELNQQIQQTQSAIPYVPVMRELEEEHRRKTHIFASGNFLNPTEPVNAATPAVFHAFPNDLPRDRLGLAHWLVDEANPLTARVVVNRVWEQFFGIGLVDTPEDFGIQGSLPSHPDLLDSLAVEFMERDWSLKELCRLIVNSATYRQSSHIEDATFARDPYNRLLSRGPRFRLSAEMIRDQALTVSGLLNRDLFGPPVYPPQPEGLWMIVYSDDRWDTSTGADRHRRSLYTFWRRTNPYPSMVVFDAPSREFCVSTRIRTNTPLQALVTMNDPVFVECAQAIARLVLDAPVDSDRNRVNLLFNRALLRPAREAELDAVAELLSAQRNHFMNHQAEAQQMATNPLGPLPESMSATEAAAWTVVCNTILNLDEFLTRE